MGSSHPWRTSDACRETSPSTTSRRLYLTTLIRASPDRSSRVRFLCVSFVLRLRRDTCLQPAALYRSRLQEDDGLQPGAVFPPESTVSMASEFVEGLLRLADNKLDKEPDSGMDEDEPASILYAAHHFRRFMKGEWLSPSANEGPFVLSTLNNKAQRSSLVCSQLPHPVSAPEVPSWLCCSIV